MGSKGQQPPSDGDGGSRLLEHRLSVCRSCAVIYMAFLGGVRKGGEWVFALIAGYGLSVLILSLSPDVGLGAVLFSLSTVAILLAILLWMKKGRAVAVAVAVTFFLTVIGGLFILIATMVPTAEQILSYSLYGLINVGLELLLMAVALRLVALFRRRAIQKGGDSADIRLSYMAGKTPRPSYLSFGGHSLYRASGNRCGGGYSGVD